MSYRMAEVIAQRSRDEDEASRKIECLRMALCEIEEIVEDKADVDDGAPNDAMRILVIVRAAISSHQRAGEKS